MILRCHALHDQPPPLVPAPVERDWMDDFPARHAYRCLPLTVANAHGWQILAPCGIRAEWNGSSATDSIRVSATDGYPWVDHVAGSHFGGGVLTLHTSWLFRTEPGWNLLVSGPLNSAKHGIAPLSGIIETDWLPYPFTMNWRFTAPGAITFAAGEPICQIFPLPRGAVRDTQPEIWRLEQDGELHGQYVAWRDRREEFMSGWRDGDPAKLKEAWQRFYFEGRRPDGVAPIDDHVHRLRPATPVDKRG